MEINGVTLNLDLDDLDVAEKAQNAIQASQTKINEIQDTADYVTGGRQVCTIVNETFDGIFGEGTAAKLFKGNRFTEHIDAFATLAEAIGQQMGKQNAHLQSLAAKYSPNRAARRHPAQKK